MKKDFSDLREDLFQFAWKHQLYTKTYWKTPKGKQVKVIFPGFLNRTSGPDFTQAQLLIDDLKWVGSVEIHVLASDWFAHGHHKDPAYDNVILHVVCIDDRQAIDTMGREIPTVEVRDCIRRSIADSYKGWLDSNVEVPCSAQLDAVRSIDVLSWLERIAIDRMAHKAHKMSRSLYGLNGDWSEMLYRNTLYYFGGLLNREPMLWLSERLPFSVVNGWSKETVEAVMLGMAGWLENLKGLNSYEKYLVELFLDFRSIYQVPPLKNQVWKWSHMYPQGTPAIRTVQASFAVSNGIIDPDFLISSSLEDVRKKFSFGSSDYWKAHIAPGKKTARNYSRLSRSMVDRWLINVWVPFLFLVSTKRRKPELKAKALEALTDIDPEKNALVQRWEKEGIEAESALETQGLIELKKEFCTRLKCLNCRIGQNILLRDD